MWSTGNAMWRCNDYDYDCELHPWCAGKAQAPPVHENFLFVHLGLAFAATATPPTELTLLSSSWTGAPERTAATATVTRLSSTPSSSSSSSSTLLLFHPLPPSFLYHPLIGYVIQVRQELRQSSRTPAHARDHVIRPRTQQQQHTRGDSCARREKKTQQSLLEFKWNLRALLTNLILRINHARCFLGSGLVHPNPRLYECSSLDQEISGTLGKR